MALDGEALLARAAAEDLASITRFIQDLYLTEGMQEFSILILNL